MNLDRGISGAHHVYQELYARIIECSMQPGETILKQEIADELDIPLGTVKSRTRLALQRLKGMISDYD